MTLSIYATEDCIWLDVFGVIKDCIEREPEMLIEIERYLEELKQNDSRTN